MRHNESEIEDQELHDRNDSQLIDRTSIIDLRVPGRISSSDSQNFRLSTALLSKQNASITCDEAVETLIKVYKKFGSIFNI